MAYTPVLSFPIADDSDEDDEQHAEVVEISDEHGTAQSSGGALHDRSRSPRSNPIVIEDSMDFTAQLSYLVDQSREEEVQEAIMRHEAILSKEYSQMETQLVEQVTADAENAMWHRTEEY